MDILRICTSHVEIEVLFPEPAQCELEEVTVDQARNWLQEQDGKVQLCNYCTLVHMDALLSFLGINISFHIFQNVLQCYQPAAGDVFLVAEQKISQTRPRFDRRDEASFIFHFVMVK